MVNQRYRTVCGVADAMGRGRDKPKLGENGQFVKDECGLYILSSGLGPWESAQRWSVVRRTMPKSSDDRHASRP